MEFSAYQRAACETSQLRLGGPQGAIAPMLGLASETGSILNVYKKYLRDGIDLAATGSSCAGNSAISCGTPQQSPPPADWTWRTSCRRT